MNGRNANIGILLVCLMVLTGACASTSDARISRVAAEQIALERVPNGTIKEGDYEKEDGRLVWSFEIETPGTPEITEIQVDAITGEIVAME